MREVGQRDATKHQVTCHPASIPDIVIKKIGTSALYQGYALTAAGSPHTIVTVNAGQKAIVYYYTIWNNDDANAADVCLYIGVNTDPFFSGHLPSNTGVVVNLVRPVEGDDDDDVILTIAGSTDVDCIVHAEVS